MDSKEIAIKLKELGLRMFGGQIWVKDETASPAFANVTAPIKVGQFGAYLEIHESDKEFVPVRLAKGVAPNKSSYDLYTYTASKDWPATEEEKKRFPNATPITKGQRTVFAH